MHACPACGSSRIYPSQARSLLERVRRVVTERQPYRCHKCQHRGWYPIAVPAVMRPDAAPEDLRIGSPRPLTGADLDRLDKN